MIIFNFLPIVIKYNHKILQLMLLFILNYLKFIEILTTINFINIIILNVTKIKIIYKYIYLSHHFFELYLLNHFFELLFLFLVKWIILI